MTLIPPDSPWRKTATISKIPATSSCTPNRMAMVAIVASGQTSTMIPRIRVRMP